MYVGLFGQPARKEGGSAPVGTLVPPEVSHNLKQHTRAALPEKVPTLPSKDVGNVPSASWACTYIAGMSIIFRN